jgi:hypothetical protein
MKLFRALSVKFVQARAILNPSHIVPSIWQNIFTPYLSLFFSPTRPKLAPKHPMAPGCGLLLHGRQALLCLEMILSLKQEIRSYLIKRVLDLPAIPWLSMGL